MAYKWVYRHSYELHSKNKRKKRLTQDICHPIEFIS